MQDLQAKIILFVVVSLQLTLFLLLIIVCFMKNQKLGQVKHRMLMSVLAFLRLILTQILFLPILDFLSFSASCYYYEDVENPGYMSSFNQNFPCILSTTHGFDTMIKYVSFFTLMIHVLGTLVMENFEYSIRVKKHSNYPM